MTSQKDLAKTASERKAGSKRKDGATAVLRIIQVAQRHAQRALEADEDQPGAGHQQIAPASTIGGARSPSTPSVAPDTKKLTEAEIARLNADLEPNDRDNARRFVVQFPKELVSVRGRGFYAWTGTHYEFEGGDETAFRLAGEAAEAIHNEAQYINERDPDLKKKLQSQRHSFACKTGNHKSQANMLAQVAVLRSIDVNDLDKDPHRFVVRNGTLEFRPDDGADAIPGEPAFRWHFLPWHDPSHLASRCLAATFDANANCPKWRAFLNQVQPDPEKQLYLQTWAGLQILGDMSHQAMVVHYGRGANGKSTYAAALAGLLANYGVTVAPQSLLSRKRDGRETSPDLVRLIGVRSVQVHEYPANERLDEALIKSLTGGETIPVRDNYKPVIDLNPRFKIEIYANERPQINGTEEGIWRRLHLVDWTVTIPKEGRRPMAQILAEFEAERSGILNWLIDGAAIYLECGLRPPTSVLHSTEEYREDSDPVGMFLRDCVRESEGSTVSGSSMYAAYESWCRANAIRPGTMTRFGRELSQRNLKKIRSGGVTYVDIILCNVPSDLMDNPHAPFADR